MYYALGIIYGLALSFVLFTFMYVSSNLLSEQIIELVSYTVLILSTATLGYIFKLRKNLSTLQLFEAGNKKYLLFPFGVSTAMVITQAIITFYSEENSLVFWVIPIGIAGQGLNIFMFLLIGMWCCRSKA